MNKRIAVTVSLIALGLGAFAMNGPLSPKANGQSKTQVLNIDTGSSSQNSADINTANQQAIKERKARPITDSEIKFMVTLLDYRGAADRLDKLETLDAIWNPSFVPMSVEVLNFVDDAVVRAKLVEYMVETTGKDLGSEANDWYQWMWNEDYVYTAGYDNFKAEFHSFIDPKFETYFKDRGESSKIRLDEVRWGGVLQDGIPPLRSPKMLTASEADYLDNDNVIFGIEVNGDARAYPKRILAWHEMFVDTVGGVKFAGVYCTLCGAVILYETEQDGVNYNMGTSGFLYRSNKLMYDKSTQSLWNTIKGEPVMGPLADKGIALKSSSVVTTTWGAWKERHPDTQVLSLDTGHRRNYGEGVAYHGYFATDDLMFSTPFNDQRLKNKAEVLALRFPGKSWEQLAISVKYLTEHPIYANKLGTQDFVVLTDDTGANRVFDPQGVDFISYDLKSKLTDSDGDTWLVSESKLTRTDGKALPRLSYHRAFWFGWHATYPQSRLIQ